jgi:hypothetical protein
MFVIAIKYYSLIKIINQILGNGNIFYKILMPKRFKNIF